MADQTVNLSRSYAVPGMEVVVQAITYTVSPSLTITVPDTVTHDQLVADLGPLLATGGAAIPVGSFFKNFSLDVSIGTKQDKFDCPAGRKTVITSIVVRSNGSGAMNAVALSFGWNAGATDVVTTATPLASGDSNPDLYALVAINALAKAGTPGDSFGALVSVTSTGTVELEIQGYYI